jgi:hypothetical protein
MGGFEIINYYHTLFVLIVKIRSIHKIRQEPVKENGTS